MISVREGKWPQQDSIDEGKNRGVGADPESQRQNDGKRECGHLHQTPDGKPDVATNVVATARLAKSLTSAFLRYERFSNE